MRALVSIAVAASAMLLVPPATAGVWLHDTGTEHTQLGTQVVNMTEELRKFFGAPGDAGVLVSKVAKDSAAERAGLRVGDVLVRVNGVHARHIRDVTRALSPLRKGDSVHLIVIRKKRKKRRLELRAPLGEEVEVSVTHSTRFRRARRRKGPGVWEDKAIMEKAPGLWEDKAIKEDVGTMVDEDLWTDLNEVRERVRDLEQRIEKLEAARR